MSLPRLFGIFVAAVVSLAASVPTQSHVALVIGNSGYASSTNFTAIGLKAVLVAKQDQRPRRRCAMVG